MSTIKILGEVFTDCEPLQNAAFRGIRAGGKEFWFVHPICDDNGKVPPVVPPYVPVEIKQLTHELPDLTGEHLDEVRQEFESLQSDSRTMTVEDLCKRYELGAPTDDAKAYSEKCRKRNLDLSFEDYRLGAGKYNCWLRHGSDALANALGYIHHDGGTHLSVAESLAMRIAGWQESKREAAREQVERIRAVAMYDDAANTRIFMAGIQVADVVVTQKPMTAEVVGEIVHSKLDQFLPLLNAQAQRINDESKEFVKVAASATGKLEERLYQIQKFFPDTPAVQRF